MTRPASVVLELSPSELLAWLALLFCPEHELVRRPGVALAHLLGVSPGHASKLLAALAKAGAASARAPRGVLPLRPEPGCVVHTHGPDSSCKAVKNVAIETPPLDGNIFAATSEIQARRLNHFCSVHSFSEGDTCTALETFPDAVPGESRNGGSAAGTAAGFSKQKLMAVFVRSPAARYTGPTLDDRYLAELYCSRRRRPDPCYGLSPKAFGAAHSLRRRLVQVGIGREEWPAYMDFAFIEFTQITKGRMSFVPTHVLVGENMMDRYLAQRGSFKFNAERAGRMLRGAGFTAHPAIVVAVARDCFRTWEATGDLPKGLAGDPDAIAAVRWLLPRMRDVGYKPEAP
ncbi:MAG: hypothetical protein ACOYOB_19555 [Myxococcota bacterium]